jgi:hypothetical protein
MIVKPRLLSFLRGGVGGLTNAGETGAEILSFVVAMTGCAARGADVDTRPREYVAVVVSTARFFKFRAFFAGVAGRCISKKGSVLDRSGGLKRAASPIVERGEIFEEAGVSGDVPGDDSVMEAESIVETVVVGEESDDSEAEVEVLFRGW